VFPNHVHQAIAQVREIRNRVVDRQQFRGYSGWARIVSGGLALIAAAVMSQPRFAGSAEALIVGWGVVFVLSAALSYGALLYWFLNDPEVGRDVRKLRPTLDPVAPLVAGGLITLALLMRGEYDLLYGTWMLLFALANFASRHVLPGKIVVVGFVYTVAAQVCLFVPGVGDLASVWSMGITFCVGEVTGGMLMQLDKTRKLGDSE